MPLPSYLRLPSSDSFRQKFWKLKPRNPTCGLISLETGAKFFAWAYMILHGSAVGLGTVAIFLLFLEYYQGHEFLDIEAQKDKMEYRDLVFLCILSLCFSGFMCRLNWKMRRAILKKDVPVLKKIFLIMLCVNILFLPLMDIEGIILLSTKSLFLDMPLTLFRISGLIFIYSFISSLVNLPDGDAQTEDMSRIEFNA